MFVSNVQTLKSVQYHLKFKTHFMQHMGAVHVIFIILAVFWLDGSSD